MHEAIGIRAAQLFTALEHYAVVSNPMGLAENIIHAVCRASCLPAWLMVVVDRTLCVALSVVLTSSSIT